jgi:hypothetical protein
MVTVASSRGGTALCSLWLDAFPVKCVTHREPHVLLLYRCPFHRVRMCAGIPRKEM